MQEKKNFEHMKKHVNKIVPILGFESIQACNRMIFPIILITFISTFSLYKYSSEENSFIKDFVIRKNKLI